MSLALLIGLGVVATLIVLVRGNSRVERVTLALLAVLVGIVGGGLLRRIVSDGGERILYVGLSYGSLFSLVVAWLSRSRGVRGARLALVAGLLLLSSWLGLAAAGRQVCLGWRAWALTCGPQTLVLVGLPLLAATLVVLLLGRRKASFGEQVLAATYAAYGILPLGFMMALTWGYFTTGKGP